MHKELAYATFVLECNIPIIYIYAISYIKLECKPGRTKHHTSCAEINAKKFMEHSSHPEDDKTKINQKCMSCLTVTTKATVY